MKHLTFEKIHSYIEGQAGNETEEITAHLVACERCNGVLASLNGVGRLIGEDLKAEAKAGCPEDWEIASLVKRELQAPQSDFLRDHIETCGFCMSRAAVYFKAETQEKIPLKTPQMWKEKAVNTLMGDNAHLKEEKSILKKFSGFVNFITSPLPAYALAAASIAILIWNVAPERSKIVSIASTQKITYKDIDSSASFGFMGGAETKEFNGMEVRKDKGELVFKWRPMKGASVSEFVLRKKGVNRDTTVAELRIYGDKVSLPDDQIILNERYEWSILGVTEDGRSFEASAEFVLSK